MSVEVIALEGIGEIVPGDDLAEIFWGAATAAGGPGLQDGDVVCVVQKAVSKSEGRQLALASVTPRARALELAARHGKDARLVQAVLDESRELLRHESGVLITETRHGFVCANAGIDASNVPGDGTVLLLPRDPDASAERLRERLSRLSGRQRLAVIVTDSFGRAWRVGQVDVAIGCAGIAPVDDLRGRTDREGRTLHASQTAVADELAAAAGLARGKASGHPVCIVRGAEWPAAAPGPAAALARAREHDLFR